MTSTSPCADATLAAEARNPSMRSRRAASLNWMRRISWVTRACARRTSHLARWAMCRCRVGNPTLPGGRDASGRRPRRS